LYDITANFSLNFNTLKNSIFFFNDLYPIQPLICSLRAFSQTQLAMLSDLVGIKVLDAYVAITGLTTSKRFSIFHACLWYSGLPSPSISWSHVWHSCSCTIIIHSYITAHFSLNFNMLKIPFSSPITSVLHS
jgi:hypothetical protein